MKKSTLHSGRGFTLVEMLVVITIITVLVLVVVGVSRIVIGRAGEEQTRLNMEVIRQAIQSYYDAKKIYPPDETDFSDQPTSGEMGSSNNPEGLRNWQAYKRGKKLYGELSSVPQARAQIANLGEDAIKNINGNNVFVDGFDKYMEYRSDEGVGDTPVIISAGGDGDFNTEKDNLRSDNQ
ncbi:MAG: prepilin-type N-terminal cleavage/methylation domain-containing protein [Phycisphaerae bacterium]|nr:prepilin-type N-terminal cleavage/methylation domain-containing protein [Phycisphaerae bacterium]